MSDERETPVRAPEAAVWQDVEFGAYEADLPLWSELAADAGGPVLELGAGAGRFSLHLAGQGVSVMALERDPELCAELRRRADDRGVAVEVVEADLASPADIRLPAAPTLVIAPLHVLQTDAAEVRLALLGALRDLLAAGGLLAAALVDEGSLLEGGTTSTQLLPDMREVDGWVYSSEPLWVQVGEERLRIRRIRERVSPEGEMERNVHDELLHRVSPERFAIEAQETGFRDAGSRQVRSGPGEADSVVALMEAV
jgi:SAM-dependent methyltransferase